MKKRPLVVILLAAIAVVVPALAPPGRTAAQPRPTLVPTASSGPCDAPLKVMGYGFPPPRMGAVSSWLLYLLQPGTTDISMETLESVGVQQDGTFSQWVELREHGCEAAALDRQAEQPAGYLAIAAAPRGSAVQPGERIPNIIAVGQYAYTTTTPQPQLTMTITPSSGPCDAPIEVRGVGLGELQVPEAGPGPALYLLRPGTGDVNVEILNGVDFYDDGTFRASLPLWKHGCEAATLDSQADHPSRYLSFALSGGGPTAQPGERIPNIIAVAQYAYTTTTPQPQPTMVLSPSSGPCDGTVQITGRDFPASTAIHLDVWAGEGEATLGTLALLTTDQSGGFAVSASLGTLGCEAARSSDGVAAGPSQFSIYAVQTHFVILPGEEGIPGFLAGNAYTYTTTVSTVPQALPSTGAGPEERSTPLMWLLLAGGLGAVGLVLVVGLLYGSRRLRS